MRRWTWVPAALSVTAVLRTTICLAEGAPASGKTAHFYPGTSLTLVLRDSSRVSGVFLDLGQQGPDAYRSRYESWRRESSAGAQLPALDERIVLGTGRITGSGKLSFCGLGHDGVAVRKGDGAIHIVAYERFSRLHLAGGKTIERRRLQSIARDPGTPLLTLIEMRTAVDTVSVPFDDVLAVESPGHPGATPRSANRFTPESEVSKVTAAIQVGGLWANGPSERGRLGNGVYGRISPTFAVNRIGLDFAGGIVTDDEGAGSGLQLDLALSGTVPIGRAFGLAPHVGLGILLGGGYGVGSVNFGGGAMARLSRGFGLRADYTYHRLDCMNCNYDAISSFQLGPYWGF